LRLLRVAEGNVAHLVFPPNNPDTVRIAITKAETKTSYDIQVNQPRLKVKSTCRYVINFLARADSPRSIGFGIAKGRAPWTNLGLYRKIDLTSEWQNVEQDFMVTEDEDNARIHFDVGDSDIAVELSSVTLQNLSEAKFVKPHLPSTRSSQSGPDKLIIEPPVQFGQVQFGSLRRITPISQDFGCDRGRPIDRYYIENFLANHGEDIRGRVLEIGDNSYTRRFGGDRVTVSDVLHVVEGDPQATIIADLASADHIPSSSFDCIILTQTLQLIYDVRAALKTVYRILKPSGILLATFPGISQTSDSEWGDCWHWNFTPVSARRLFGEVFPATNVQIETFGNVLAAISFLHGIAVEELTPEELDYREPGYDVTISVRAIKPAVGNQINGIDRSQKATRQLRGAMNSKALILMYHAVAEGCSDPWSLCVSPQHFARQLEVLRKHTQPTQLQQLVAALHGGDISRRAVIVTFDDGYADNLLNAKPLLERFDIPATVFLTAGYIGDGREFWWDELDRLLLQPGTLPQILRLSVNGIPHQWELGEAAYYSEERWQQDRSWKAPEAPPSSRHSLYVSLWNLLQPLPESERRNVLEQLLAWACAEPGARPTRRTLSLEEVGALGRGELVEIGSHTVTHPVLPGLPLALQRNEVQQSKIILETILGRPVASFAYPYGSYTTETIPIIQEAGFACACSTVAGVVERDADRFQLPRLEVRDWDGEEFRRRLQAWFD
jgi:peptidoglycan/xylan/chitin deacetylase (PgdA/CDA1 family)/SAM-dependent methyltransferase